MNMEKTKGCVKLFKNVTWFKMTTTTRENPPFTQARRKKKLKPTINRSSKGSKRAPDAYSLLNETTSIDWT